MVGLSYCSVSKCQHISDYSNLVRKINLSFYQIAVPGCKRFLNCNLTILMLKRLGYIKYKNTTKRHNPCNFHLQLIKYVCLVIKKFRFLVNRFWLKNVHSTANI